MKKRPDSNTLKFSSFGKLGKGMALSGLALAMNLGVSCNKQQERPDSPNVLLIVSDDQGLGDISRMGNGILETPNLDALCSESSRLTNFLVSPLCSPSRASIMTGRYNYRTGVWDTWQGGAVLNENEKTIADYLRDHGYRTGHFGKWHLGENAPARAQDRGFETTVEFAGSRTNPDMEINGKSLKGTGFAEDILFEKAIEFIESPSSKPFFAFVCSYMPHDYSGSGPPVPEEWVRPFRSYPELKPGDQEIYGMVANLDAHVGQLLAALKRSSKESNTIVVFLSDNGPLRDCPELKSLPEQLAIREHKVGARYNVGLRGGKMTPFQGGITAPCFIRWPGKVPADRDVNVLSAHIDLVPTILSLCGIAVVPKNPFDGVNLVPYLLGDASSPPPDRAIVIQQDREQPPRKWINTAVVREGWKLLDGKKLFNVGNDPAESHDVAQNHPAIVARLRSDYEKWWNDVTSTNSFRSSLTDLGSPAQEQSFLHIYQRPPAGGWPVRFMRDGIYTFKVEGIQKELLQPGARVILQIGAQSYGKPVPESGDCVTWTITRNQEAASIVDVRIEPTPKSARMYYGNEDLGWRDITVRWSPQISATAD